MANNAPTGDYYRQGDAPYGEGQSTSTDRVPTGLPPCQLTAVERAFQLAERCVKELKKKLASEGFGMADLEGPYLARQLINRMVRNN